MKTVESKHSIIYDTIVAMYNAMLCAGVNKEIAEKVFEEMIAKENARLLKKEH